MTSLIFVTSSSSLLLFCDFVTSLSSLNRNYIGDLDLEVMGSLRPWTYLPCEYGDDRGSLRPSNVYFKGWPWKVNIWPWGQKFKILPHSLFAYGHSTHTYAFLALSDEKCGRSSRKYAKMVKFDQFIAPGDLDLGGPTLRHMPRSYFFIDAYNDQVSRKLKYDKGVKMLWLTPERTNGRTE